jgi:quercetin dioxygenase-like cupin family protein
MKVSLTSLPASGPLELHSYISESPAGSQSGPHRHPYSTLVYVLAGTYRLEVGERRETVTDYTAGQAFSEPAGVTVNGRAMTHSRLLVIVPAEPRKPESEAV